MCRRMERKKHCYLIITYQQDVNEQCVLGVIGSLKADYRIVSRQLSTGTIKLTLEFCSAEIPMDAIRYLSCMDGIQQVFVTGGDGREDAA